MVSSICDCKLCFLKCPPAHFHSRFEEEVNYVCMFRPMTMMKTALATVVFLLVTTRHTASPLSIRRQTPATARTATTSIPPHTIPPTDQHHHHRSILFSVRRQFLQATLSAAKATSTQLAYSVDGVNDSRSRRRGVSSSFSSSSSSWLDRTTARILSSSLDEDEYDNEHMEQRQQRLTSDDVSLITHLMSAHARRGTVSSAVTCERLLHRVVVEVDRNNSRHGSSHNVANANDRPSSELVYLANDQH